MRVLFYSAVATFAALANMSHAATIKPAHHHNYGYADFHSQIDTPTTGPTTTAKPTTVKLDTKTGEVSIDGSKGDIGAATCALKKIKD